LTAKDVRFSVELLKSQGRPQHRAAYGKIKSIQTPDNHTIRFDLSGANDRELPLILALMPVLPAHATDVKTFSDSTLKPPLGSGPYVLQTVKPGQSLRFVRNKDYWASNLAVQRGLYNFDEIRLEYFRDGSSLFEAFKAGLVDYRDEGEPGNWRTGYDFPALRDGRVLRKSAPLGGAKGMNGYAFNTRRAIFADKRVREALAMTFDFEWLNTNLYGGLFTRTKSFFDNTPLSAAGRPASDAEKRLLAPWPGIVRPDIMDGSWRMPVHNGSGRDRKIARAALKLLTQAGYRMLSGKLVHKVTGRPLSFEILVLNRDQEKLALVYTQWLRRIGVTSEVRNVDLVQYQRRRQKFDFDMIMGWWIASNSPGNEQYNRWSSHAAGVESSHNLAGVRSAAVDGLIGKITAAHSKEDFAAAVRAYDRVLLSGFYIVPHFHKSRQWFAYSSKLAYPARLPKYATPLFGTLLDTWWRPSE
ncbi:MAG: extracellular solute-binding protein, partial [Beijerinckiaceae bacterium]|nr:extracellular solute-binding protein [Beijerinckiaceae bacterium]